MTAYEYSCRICEDGFLCSFLETASQIKFLSDSIKLQGIYQCIFQWMFKCKFNEPKCKNNIFGCKCGKSKRAEAPEPPKAPRFLAPHYVKNLRYWKNPSFLVGAGFCIFLISI